MAGLKPQRIEAYRCPKCNAVLTIPYGQAQAHVDVPVDQPFKKGFVFQTRFLLYRITGEGSLCGCLDQRYVHGWDQIYATCALKSTEKEFRESFLNRSSTINSKKIREQLENGEWTLADVETAKSLRKINGCMIHRTDPSLEARTK